jgi:hypothetical protein
MVLQPAAHRPHIARDHICNIYISWQFRQLGILLAVIFPLRPADLCHKKFGDPLFRLIFRHLIRNFIYSVFINFRPTVKCKDI